MDTITMNTDALTAVGLAVLVLDEQNQIIDGNVSAFQLLGREPDEVIGKSVLSLLPLTVLHEREATCPKAPKLIMAQELVVRAPTESPLFLSVSVSSCTDALGQVRSTVLMRDVSAERRDLDIAQKELALSAHAIQRAKIGVFEYDPATDTVTVSAVWRELLEIAPDEQLDMQEEWRSRVHPDDLAIAIRPVQLCLEGLVERASCEYRLQSRDRTHWRWMQTNIAVLHRDSSGSATRIVGAQIDVSERKQTEEDLQRSLEQFRSSFEHAPIGKAIVRLDGRWLKVNSALCNLFGYTEEELLQTDFQSLTHPDDLEADLANAAPLIKGEINSYQMEKRYIRSNGAVMWCLLSVGLVRDGQGRPDHGVAQVVDITEQRRLDQLKSDFIAVVSHELRTPLTSVLGAVSLLETFEDEGFSDEVQRLLFIAKTNGERLRNLINDILDFQKFSAHQMRFTIVPCPVASLVEETLLANLALVDKYTVRFKPTLPDRSLVGLIDPKRFHQIMANLLTNAAKFAHPETEIEVTANGLGSTIRVSISNIGPGIPDSFHNLVFKPFSQAENPSDRKSGGTGLGLSITKQIVEQMGGTIGFESAPGALTTFWFTFQATSSGTLGSESK
ncbi:PAS domain S-box protein [Pseudotabrizicola sp.]|uniref:sensor histidine kinase n=2 Tax=Pseudotabrizicola sp. TaxID=2939647 RepID=UPI0027317C4A|nr:PAS domain S-box protein [Pseudotabrizicola sp.]MDP2081193.1 PAS domain S-box protein [Pseudotabrizicola sp.]